MRSLLALLVALFAGAINAQEPAPTNGILILRGGEPARYAGPPPSSPANQLRTQPVAGQPGYGLEAQNLAPVWPQPPQSNSTNAAEQGVSLSDQGLLAEPVSSPPSAWPSQDTRESRHPEDSQPASGGVRETIVMRERPLAEQQFGQRGLAPLGMEHAIAILVGLILCLLLLLAIFVLLFRRVLNRSELETTDAVYHAAAATTGSPRAAITKTVPDTASETVAAEGRAGQPDTPTRARLPTRPSRATQVVQFAMAGSRFDEIQSEYNEQRKVLAEEASQEQASIMARIVADNVQMKTKLGLT